MVLWTFKVECEGSSVEYANDQSWPLIYITIVLPDYLWWDYKVICCLGAPSVDDIITHRYGNTNAMIDSLDIG